MSERQKERTFLFILFIYFSIYFYLGILPANIDNLLTQLSGASSFGVSFIITLGLICLTISMLFFGYFSNHLSQRIGRKNLFIITNLLWIISIGVVSISPNYIFFIVFYMIAAFGNGAFLPLGFSIVGDLYGPEQRGTKFGMMYVGLSLGSGLGIIFGGLLGWRLGFLVSCILGAVGIFGYFKHAIDPKSTEYQETRLVQEYNNQITAKTLIDVVKTKTVLGILISVFCSGIATSTISNWGIFYLNLQLNNKMMAILFYIIAGVGAILGSCIGGMLGDIFYDNEKLNGRIKISILGIVLGPLFLLGFYHYAFIMFGIFGYFFVFFSSGNQFAIYSDVCTPETRSVVNSLNGVMINIGGIVGSVIVSATIYQDLSLISLSITIVLVIWSLSAVFWLIPYFYYTNEINFKALRMKERFDQIDIYA